MARYKVIALGEILGKYKEERIVNQTLKSFVCQRETDLEFFLVNKAIPYEKTNFGKTFLIIDEKKLIEDDELVIMAYFTLAQKAVDISHMPKKRKRKLLGEYPGRDTVSFIPVYLIGQLGRSDVYSSEDLSGSQILAECYEVINKVVKVIGGNLVMLECREHMYENFYEKQGYAKFYDELNSDGLYTLYKKIE